MNSENIQASLEQPRGKKALEQPLPYNGPIVQQELFRTAGELRGLTDKGSDDFIDASGKSGCCWKIHLTNVIGHRNDAFDQRSYYWGYYTQEPGHVNGKVHYTSTHHNGKYAVWFAENGDWIVGFSSKRGKAWGGL